MLNASWLDGWPHICHAVAGTGSAPSSLATVRFTAQIRTQASLLGSAALDVRFGLWCGRLTPRAIPGVQQLGSRRGVSFRSRRCALGW